MVKMKILEKCEKKCFSTQTDHYVFRTKNPINFTILLNLNTPEKSNKHSFSNHQMISSDL